MEHLEFRVWDDRDKKMRAVTELYWSSGEICAIEDAVNGEFPIIIPWDEHAKVLQFTGLHDKNGKEIYEGDIVRWNYISHAQSVVAYHPHSAAYLPFAQLHLEKVRDTIEVIGNIYENSNLLKN